MKQRMEDYLESTYYQDRDLQKGKYVTERISLSLSILFGTEQQVAKSAIERYERKDMKDTE